jgi:intermediate cleaving peptidase 55
VSNDFFLQLRLTIVWYSGYASDISSNAFYFVQTRFINFLLSILARTYPSTGTFTPAQAELYTALLSAQKELCAVCTESAGHTLNSLHQRSCQLLKAELNQIGFGLQNGDLERALYPHFLSHPIGIDLHESSQFDRSAE